MIWFSPRTYAGIRPSIATPFQRAPVAGFGSLGRLSLPSELLRAICSHMDMHSLSRFRHTNLAARQTVDSLLEYQLLVEHCPSLFCTLLRTRLASTVSLFDVYDMLCGKVCNVCGEFAGFVLLLTWTRCCFSCTYSPRAPVDELCAIVVAKGTIGHNFGIAPNDGKQAYQSRDEVYSQEGFLEHF